MLILGKQNVIDLSFPKPCPCPSGNIGLRQGKALSNEGIAGLHPQSPGPLAWHESHKPYGPPTSVTWLQLLRKQTNTGTSTALTAETHRSTCTSLTNLTALQPQSHNYSCYVSRPILAPPPLWLHKHTDLHVQVSQTLWPSYLSHMIAAAT
jgi:hypothetical protein